MPGPDSSALAARTSTTFQRHRSSRVANHSSDSLHVRRVALDHQWCGVRWHLEAAVAQLVEWDVVRIDGVPR